MHAPLKFGPDRKQRRKSVFLVRHATSLRNAGLYWPDGPVSLPLTPGGEAAASEFAARWSTQPDIIIQSTYKRSQQTAAPLAARFPSARLITLPVHEFTFFSYKIGVDLGEEALRECVNGYWERCDPWEKGGTGSECFVEFIERCRAVFSWARSSAWAGTAVCFSHGFFMHALRTVANGVDLPPSALMRHLRATLPDRSYANLEMTELVIEPDHGYA